jgi:hypothetical protein
MMCERHGKKKIDVMRKARCSDDGYGDDGGGGDDDDDDGDDGDDDDDERCKSK